MRDLLTHGPFAPLLRERVPEISDHVLAGYRRVVDPDEVLVDIVRAHNSKIAAQWALPLPHLEVAGRSPKDRGEVLLPRDLRLRVDPDGTAALTSPRFPGRRVRLLASISGADTIRHDPVAPFAFPRSLGGGLFDEVDLPLISPGLWVRRLAASRAQNPWYIDPPARRRTPREGGSTIRTGVPSTPYGSHPGRASLPAVSVNLISGGAGRVPEHEAQEG